MRTLRTFPKAAFQWRHYSRHRRECNAMTQVVAALTPGFRGGGGPKELSFSLSTYESRLLAKHAYGARAPRRCGSIIRVG